MLHSARQVAARHINTLVVVTNYEVGRRIVEHEQGGEQRADYGRKVVTSLSKALTAEFGRGFSAENLWLMRRFYLAYRDRLPLTGTAPGVSGPGPAAQILQTPSTESDSTDGGDARGNDPFTLSWSHYTFLIGIKDESARSFYEIEAERGRWSLKELRRQFDSALYERLALSRDKDGVRSLAEKGQVVTRPEEVLKDPYVLEFLGLDESAGYSESDLESRIIDKLQHFLR